MTGENFPSEFRPLWLPVIVRTRVARGIVLCIYMRIDKVNIKESILFCDGATPDTDVDCTFVGSAFNVCLG